MKYTGKVRVSWVKVRFILLGSGCFLHFSDLTVANLLSCATITRLGIKRMSFCVSKVRFVRLSLVSLGPGGP